MPVITVTIPEEQIAIVTEALCDGVDITDLKAHEAAARLIKDYVRNYLASKTINDAAAEADAIIQAANVAAQTVRQTPLDIVVTG